MKAMVVRIAREALVAEDREVPQPGRAEVRIRIHAVASVTAISS